jgi:hypothetical protein
MADQGLASDASGGWPEIDTNVAHVARVYDYLLGGKANFAVDREAAQRAFVAWPGGLDGARADARAHRALLGRMVRYLAGEARIRQFLDIGTGIPKEDNTHEVAQRTAPESKVVYVDYDPIVLRHAHELLRSTPEGACAYIRADLRHPDAILIEAAKTLDLAAPTAVVLLGVLHFVADAEQLRAIVASLTGALTPGSYLAISHMASDVHSVETSESFGRLNEQMSESVTLRNREEVAELFDGLELVEPGVVQIPQWRPDGSGNVGTAVARPLWCGIGRKP